MAHKIEEYEELIKGIVLDSFKDVPAKIFLFGSRAKATNRENSDFDVGIEAKEEMDYELMLRTKSKLSDLLVKVDLVDMRTKDDTFREIANKDIKIWKNL